MKTFIILGYGIPKNILKDDHYNHYLDVVFNRIFDASANEKALIILSGGKTDMQKPYRRTEAQEMKRLFKKLADRSVVKKATHQWSYVLEEKSLSSLENILYSQQILKKKKVSKTNLTIFCEQTRNKKITTFTKKIFKTSHKLAVYPIDFDMSQNRYSTDLVVRKETEDIKFSLWALQSTVNLRKYRKVFQDKIYYLRKQNSKNHPEAIRQWWESKLKELASDSGYTNF